MHAHDIAITIFQEKPHNSICWSTNQPETSEIKCQEIAFYESSPKLPNVTPTLFNLEKINKNKKIKKNKQWAHTET